MANCPECGEPLDKEAGDKRRYCCENESCIVMFVHNPDDPQKMRIAYTSFARSRSRGLPRNALNHKSVKQKLGLARARRPQLPW